MQEYLLRIDTNGETSSISEAKQELPSPVNLHSCICPGHAAGLSYAGRTKPWFWLGGRLGGRSSSGVVGWPGCGRSMAAGHGVLSVRKRSDYSYVYSPTR